jgi:biotin carboxyl carrier protein
MKYTVKIDDQSYDVEVKDLRARPIVAVVDGVEIEVWPESSSPSELPAPAKPVPVTHSQAPAPVTIDSEIPGSIPPSLAGKVVHAPIPGVIVSILVKAGDEVAYGKELLTLEAMKMRNAIRATRSGVIAKVLVEVGQSVNHSDPLVEFTE